MAKSRTKTVLWVIVAIPVLIFLFVVGLWSFVILTTRPIHPDAQSVSTVAGSTPSTDWSATVEQARQAVRADVAAMNLPGLSVAVGVGGTVVWAEGFGWADVENQVKVAPNTRFRIGTASKMLTSAAVGMLVEKGELNLDDEIQTYVRAFPKKPWPVTLRQLMTHTSGLRRDAGDEEPVRVHCNETLEALPRFADKDLLFEPGTAYRYSNYGWILVSGAVESAAREPFARFMRRQIFEPLSMDNTRAEAATGTSPDQSVYYFPRFAADTRYGTQGPETADFSCFSGASAFLSTPSDMVRFIMAVKSGKLLKPETVQQLQTSQRLPTGEETGYGLGWDLETVTLGGQQARVIGYDGDLRDGQVSSFLIFPDRDLIVAVMSNMSFADTTAIAMKTAEAFAKTPPAPAESILFHSDRSGTEEIFVMEPDGSNVRQLTHVGRRDVASIDAEGSPDRRRIAFSSNRTGSWDDLYVMDADGGNVRQLTDTSVVSERDAAWSPDGRHIAYSALPRPAIAADGTRQDRQPGQIWIIDTDGSNARALTSGRSRNIRPAWSPDGSVIAFMSDRHADVDTKLMGTDEGDLEIYLMDRNGSNIRRLTDGAPTALTPAWSPDGKRIAFHTYHEGLSHIQVINADGGNQQRLTDGPRVDGRPAWSPDGKQIVFNCGPDQHEKREICVINADGSGFKTLTNNAAYDGHPDWW